MSGLYDNMEYRFVKRNAFCRGCDKKLKRDEDKAITMYSWRNRGQNILLCPDCVGKAFSMVVKDQLEEKELAG